MTNSFSKPVFRYYPDYKSLSDAQSKRFQIQTQGGRNEMKAYIANGESIEFLLRETFERLENVRSAWPGGWNGERQFLELKGVLTGDAEDAYDELVDRDYPNTPDKTPQNYITLCRDVINRLSDHVNPGDRVHQFISTGIKYVNCKMQDDSGRYEKPVKVYNRMSRMIKMGALMTHNQGAQYFTDEQFKQAFWNIFPESMKSWLVNDQRMDPFSPDNPLDPQEIADEMQRYWNMNYKDYKKNKNDGQGGNKNKRSDDDDGGEQGGGGKRQRRGGGNNNQPRRGGGNNNNQGGGHNQGGGNNQGGGCPIKGHENYRHGWSRCFLNPYARDNKFNADDAKVFYDTKANNGNDWYKDVYEKFTGNNNRPFQQGGYGGRGRGGGRGYNGGRNSGRGRGGGRGYHNQYQYHNQGEHQGQGQGYYYNGGAPAPAEQGGGYHQYHSGPPAPTAPAAPSAPPAAPAAPASAYSYSYQRGTAYGRRQGPP